MKNLKDSIWLIALGATLIAYAHANFATKNNIASIFTMLQTMSERVGEIEKKAYEIHGMLRKDND